jgi:RHS repeat-associated protein
MSALAPDAPSPAFEERLVTVLAGVGLLLLSLVFPFTEDPIEQRTFAVASDGQGNVRALYDMADGQRVALYEYGPFGEPLRVSGLFAEANPMRWSSKFTDPETGWSYYGHRYFLPAQGRWASRDPLGETGGLNLYTGIANNPADFVDPTGRQVLIEPVAAAPDHGTPSSGDFAWVDARPLSLYAAPASTETAGLRDAWFDNLASTRPFDEYDYQKYHDILLNGEAVRWKYDLAEGLWELGQAAPDLCLALATEGFGLYASLAAKSLRLSSLTPRAAPLALPAQRAGSFNPHLPGGAMTSFEVAEGGLFLPAGRTHGANPAGSFLSVNPIPNQAYVRGSLATISDWNPATHVSDAFVPQGVRLQMSIANPHPSLPGSGYGLQLQILNDADKARIIYSNTRPLQ